MRESDTWYVQRTISGFAVQWHVETKSFVTARPDQYGAVKFLSYSNKAVGVANAALFDELKDAAADIVLAFRAHGKFRHGSRLDASRQHLCECICAELNKRGISPHKQLSTCQRPEGDR